MARTPPHLKTKRVQLIRPGNSVSYGQRPDTPSTHGKVRLSYTDPKTGEIKVVYADSREQGMEIARKDIQKNVLPTLRTKRIQTIRYAARPENKTAEQKPTAKKVTRQNIQELRQFPYGKENQKQSAVTFAKTTPPDKRLAAYEKRVLKLYNRERAAQARSEKATEIFSAIPFLREKKITDVPESKKQKAIRYAQKATKGLLAFPVTATVGFGEQIIISAGKAAAAIEGLTIPGARKQVTKEAGRAAKATPKAVVQTFDIRDPNKLANLIGIAATLGYASKLAARSGKGVKVTSAKAVKTKTGTIIKQKGKYISKSGKKLNVEVTRKVGKTGKGTVNIKLKKGGRTLTSKTAPLRIAPKYKLKLPKGLERGLQRFKTGAKKGGGRLAKSYRRIVKPIKRISTKAKGSLKTTGRSLKIKFRRKIGKAEIKYLEAKKTGKQFIKDLREVNRNDNIRIIAARGKLTYRGKALISKLKARLKQTRNAAKDRIVKNLVDTINRDTIFRVKLKKTPTLKIKYPNISNKKMAKLILAKKIKPKQISSAVRKQIRKLYRARLKGIKKAAEKKNFLQENSDLIHRYNLIKRVKGISAKGKLQRERAQFLIREMREAKRLRNDYIKSQRMVTGIKLNKAAKNAAKLNKFLQQQKKNIPSKGGEQILILKKPKIEKLTKKVGEIKKAKTPTQAKKAYKEVVRDTGGVKQQLQLILKKPKVKTNPRLTGKIYAQLAAATAIVGLAKNTLASKFRRRPGSSISPVSQSKPKGKQGTSTESKEKIIEKITEKTITIPGTTILLAGATAAAVQQIINNIVNKVGDTRYIQLTRGGGIIDTKQSNPRRGISLKNYLFKKIHNKRKIYLPDMYSLIFGVRAKKGQRVRLLKPGRLYTGAELRPLVR